MRFLAIDIGSSFIKSAVLNLEERALEHLCKWPIPRPPEAAASVCELAIKPLAAKVRSVIEQEVGRHTISGVAFSVQMHGMLLTSTGGRRLTDYVTWQDLRALQPLRGGKSSTELVLSRVPQHLLARTGTNMSPAHSVLQLIATREALPHVPVRLSLLGDALIEALTGERAPIHETNACSTGLYDVYSRCWLGEMVELLNLQDVELPRVITGPEPSGELNVSGRRIPLFTAVGDQQAAILGAMPNKDELMINIGTGSQLICLTDKPMPGPYSIRPLFDGQAYRTVSHLPAGRELSVLLDFLMDVGKRLFDVPDANPAVLWEKLRRFDMESLQEQNGLELDLSFFLGTGSGNINGIGAGNLRFEHLFEAAYRDMARRYHQSYKTMCGTQSATGIMLAGGMPGKAPRLCSAIEEQFQVPCRFTPHTEDTLVGLYRLALYYSGLADGLDDTIALLEGLRIESEPGAKARSLAARIESRK
jgi:sugar (pentulose or hexulose) kinase